MDNDRPEPLVVAATVLAWVVKLYADYGVPEEDDVFKPLLEAACAALPPPLQIGPCATMRLVMDNWEYMPDAPKNIPVISAGKFNSASQPEVAGILILRLICWYWAREPAGPQKVGAIMVEVSLFFCPSWFLVPECKDEDLVAVAKQLGDCSNDPSQSRFTPLPYCLVFTFVWFYGRLFHL